MPELNTETVPVRKAEPTLRDFCAPLFRRKKTVVFIFCGILAGTILTAYLVSMEHRASMEILVNSERLDPLVTPQPTQNALIPVSDAEVNSEIELLKGEDLLREVVVACHLDNIERKSLINRTVYGKQDDAWYLAKAAQHLGSKLSIKQVAKTSMIEITYTSPNARLAFNILKTLGDRYLEKHLAVHRPPGSYAFFTGEALKYQQAMQESEARLADFTRKSGDAAPEVEKTAMAQHVVDFVAALDEVHQHIAANKERILDEEARLKVTPERSLSVEATDSAQSLLQTLQADLLGHQIKRTELTLKYDPSYPLVQEQDQEIAQTQAAIAGADKFQYVNQTTDRDPVYQVIRQDIVKTRAELASNEASAAALEDSIRNLQQQTVELAHRGLKQADLTRELKTNETSYLLYVSKREQERTSDALDEKRIANVAIAVPPILPVLPFISPVLVVLIGIALAMFASTATAFAAEYLNPSLRTPAEVVEVLRIPVLASVPKQSA